MCEPLESRELPEGKGSLGDGERQRGTPPKLEHEPVGESRSLGGWGAEPCSTKSPRSTSSPFSEPASEPCGAKGSGEPGGRSGAQTAAPSASLWFSSSCQIMELESGTFSASGIPEPDIDSSDLSENALPLAEVHRASRGMLRYLGGGKLRSLPKVSRRHKEGEGTDEDPDLLSSPGTHFISGQQLNLTRGLGHPLTSDLQLKWFPPERSSLSSPTSDPRLTVSPSRKWGQELAESGDVSRGRATHG
ncbi:hypothetical protein EYF80_008084 [Liparis tanakae]|uniref:Uncharacterized protein n=1 Tax=Liparis tanakae TaxID=230148 RepID=A0A4Z2IVV1_9TELE|nr:hypothetical protein EYF80_008084 [Liparis tanakae]